MMTNYHLKATQPSPVPTQEKKAARKKLLEEVRARRREVYKRFEEHKKEAFKKGYYAA